MKTKLFIDARYKGLTIPEKFEGFYSNFVEIRPMFQVMFVLLFEKDTYESEMKTI